ncbi:MAG: AAA family ATPase, partial [Elusimicrobiota bacterium]
MTYRPRVVDEELIRRLSSTGAVVIEGPKACGKTATAREIAASEVLLDIDEAARNAIAIDPALALTGAVPRLIDEWQVAPAIWNHIRRTVDARGAPGQFILTGSAVPADDITRHGGAGRLTRLRMRPMSLFEMGQSSGTVSLKGLLRGKSYQTPDTGVNVATIAQRIAVGGWPGLLNRDPDKSLESLRDYLEEIRRTDIRRVDQKYRDPEKVGGFLRSSARNVATYASLATLAADTAGADGTLKEDTASEYLTALQRLMFIEDQPAWAPHLRSKSRVRSMPKR